MNSNKPTILYFHNVKSSFVDKDIELLSTEYTIKPFYFNVSPKNKVIPSFFLQFFFLIRNFSSKAYVIQFGGFHSFLPVLIGKLLNKKSVIVLGGTDCVSFPSINYGNFNRKLLGYFTKISLKYASLLLPVDETLINYRYEYQSNDFQFQGYKNFISGIKTPVQVVHNGYDFHAWNPITNQKERNSFVTIGANLSSRFGFNLKGIDLIIEVAKLNPTCKFYVVGGKGLKIDGMSENVILEDKIPNNQLANYLATKRFYLQLSMSEGFPNALCEAMLCNCIPIVSAVGAMPMIVDQVGHVLKNKDVTQLNELINNAIQPDNIEKLNTQPRNRIIDKYSLESRKLALIKYINHLINY